MKKSTEGASRFHYLIPIEIQDRELEAKLLISLYILLKNKNARVILGQSGNMNVVSAMFNYPSILLDKSCSRSMYEGRIKFVISHGGRVVINDEEGINNIPDNYKEFYHRYHKPVISSY